MAQPQVSIDPDEMLRAEIAQLTLRLPPLPGVAAQVLAISADGDAAELARLIQQDQSLASNVLRIVNSPSFRGASEIVALQQAIARLGLSRITEMALSISLKAVLDQPGPFDALIQQAWQRALGAGLWAREVARLCRKNVENAYLSGLMHNIGIPVVLHRLSAMENGQGPIAAPKAQQLANTYAQQVGLMLIASWRLPKLLSRYVEVGGEYTAAGQDADLMACVSAGIAIATLAEDQSLSAEALVQIPALTHLNLYPDDAQSLVELHSQVQQQMSEMNA